MTSKAGHIHEFTKDGVGSTFCFICHAHYATVLIHELEAALAEARKDFHDLVSKDVQVQFVAYKEALARAEKAETESAIRLQAAQDYSKMLARSQAYSAELAEDNAKLVAWLDHLGDEAKNQARLRGARKREG